MSHENKLDEATKNCWNQVQENGNGDVDAFKHFVSNLGANINHSDEYNRNMLMFAAKNDKIEIFEFLLTICDDLVFEDTVEHSNIMHYIGIHILYILYFILFIYYIMI